jgi:predicted glycogen debranching enzyme
MDPTAEWLETDGLGGFAMGTVSGVRTRRYHGALVWAAAPPTGRRVLVSGFDVAVERAGTTEALSAQEYLPDVRHPDGPSRLSAFHHDPWPTWTYRLAEGAEVQHELFMPRGTAVVVLLWSLRGAQGPATLVVRPFLADRDYHHLCKDTGTLPPAPEYARGLLRLRAQPSGAPISLATNGAYHHEPHWYRSFRYDTERERGLDCVEDLPSPGVLRFDLSEGPAALVVTAPGHEAALAGDALLCALGLRDRERARRASIADPLARAALAYRVRRGSGETVIAGYPWFTDWGRDTFIAMRGLCLATDDLPAARAILVEWADVVSDGMLPNRFCDSTSSGEGDAPEWNAVDASLWFVVVAHELLARCDGGASLSSRDRTRLRDAVQAVLEGYARGTRHRIHQDGDGLLAAGEPGVQLTWMDAKVGDYVVTPRIGKPVEIQALWWNALSLAGRTDARWRLASERCHAAFHARFWNEARGCLFDVVDVDHVADRHDAAVRPNQIFAVGGLPEALLTGPRAQAVVDTVEHHLWTPLGLRSLAPGEPGYRARYAGGPWERDTAYHQGTVWPWLLGPFVEAWLRVRGFTAEARGEARARFLEPALAHLCTAGLGHVSEVADGDPPHTPGGCPFQAWSMGELMRVRRLLSD